MESRKQTRSAECRKKSRKHLFIMFLFFIFAVVFAGWIFTNGKTREAQKIITEYISEENADAENVASNPLCVSKDESLIKRVEAYYAELVGGQEFSEAYNDIVVYTKNGRYKGDYVVFARYKMKIKDIYSEVPGLQTLWASWNEENNEYQIYSEASDEQMKSDIQMVMDHEDVCELFASVETEYNETIKSDALLREALADLQNAVEVR